MTLIDAVNARLTMKDVLEYCGINVNRNGMAMCALHEGGDKVRSTRVDDRHFRCLICGAEGDPVDYIAQRLSCTRERSAAMLANDFHIEYDEPAEQPAQAPAPEPAKEPEPAPEPASEPITIAPNGNLSEAAVCREYLRTHQIICCDRRFFTADGLMDDESDLKSDIVAMIEPYAKTKLSARADSIIETLRVLCRVKSMPPRIDRIEVANGSLGVDGVFTGEKDICLNRLPVRWNPDAPAPKLWYSFLADLLEPEDIPTLQEYMGYLLLPTTKGQKMLMILGQGGEGKSRIGLVLHKILGRAMCTGSLQKIETNRFARADLQYKLAMVDDDMQLSALPDTSYIKSIITTEDLMDLEVKGRQSFQGMLYSRFLCFGNGALSALYDRSYGFFRRQIILTAKPVREDRKDDPFLAEKMCLEAEGIFLWMFRGLQRLARNHFRFTVSEKAQENLAESMALSNNVAGFLESDGYIEFHAEGTASSRLLYQRYTEWCDDNAVKPLSMRSFSVSLAQCAARYRLEYDKHINIGGGRRVRGYIGITSAGA